MKRISLYIYIYIHAIDRSSRSLLVSFHFLVRSTRSPDEPDTGEKKKKGGRLVRRPGSSGWKSLSESAFGVERVARRAFPSQGIVSVDNNGRTVFQQGITHGECIYTVVKVSRPKTASG